MLLLYFCLRVFSRHEPRARMVSLIGTVVLVGVFHSADIFDCAERASKCMKGCALLRVWES